MSNGTYALITGGSEGIGLEIAKQFAADGTNLVLVSRNEEKLTKAKAELLSIDNVDIITYALDLSSLDSAEALHAFIHEKNISVSYLINNAGFGIDGNFSEQSTDDMTTLLNLHILTLTKLCRLFIPDLEKNRGSILNVSSIAAFQPLPSLSIYGASKVYVYNFSLALRSELRKRGINVSVICPPVTRTNFYSTETMHNGYGRLGAWTFTTEFVAQRAYNGIKNNKAVIMPGISTWIYCTIISKLIPWRIIL
jgi:short-subunit dehydrogenase